MAHQPKSYEHSCLDDGHRINLGNYQADMKRIDENRVVVIMANGGYILLYSESPIEAVIEPNGGYEEQWNK